MSTATGRAAEDEAANFLLRQGYEVIDRNWRTRWCEIDIVAHKNGAIAFVEVKYRASGKWGGGIDYITPRKLQQMQFAAEFWIARHKLPTDYHLAAIELGGTPPQVTDWLQDID